MHESGIKLSEWDCQTEEVKKDEKKFDEVIVHIQPGICHKPQNGMTELLVSENGVNERERK